MNPSGQDLQDLVLDYLIHNCHTAAARAFMNECGVKRVDSDGDDTMMTMSERKMSEEDLQALEERLAMGELQIRNHILSGRIDDATELLNKHFPTVLSEPMDDGSEPSSSRKFQYIPATSTNPTHLALNLRIQAFVEAARTIPLSFRPPGSDESLAHPPLLSAAANSSSSDGGEDVNMSESEAERANVRLLHLAQSLYSEVNRLPPSDRATYLVELSQVGGILAYTVPERSPLDIYMTQGRREAVADQVDSAILYRAKRPTISRIELYARYTAALWSMLHEKGIPVPPRNKWPAGVSLPPARAAEQKPTAKDSGSLDNAIPTAKKATTEKEADEVLPPFDLHLFVKPQPSS
ncbi:hypothetical protein BN946_scf184799.g10 [Trametes cinnabarina]|uniref:CRA domain-containing protein n=1 Tax=Pycnoporus cinnabarinus TaxID=5643 RepID=A0A060S7E1_PYCCI|nr:hypothetical protein BN946_scf184799.g10 [Trametes cinnabarina]